MFSECSLSSLEINRPLFAAPKQCKSAQKHLSTKLEIKSKQILKSFIFGLARVSNADAHIYLTFSLKVRCFIMLSFEHSILPLCTAMQGVLCCKPRQPPKHIFLLVTQIKRKVLQTHISGKIQIASYSYEADW